MKTVSLDLAKQLKEKGYPQEGYSHYWGGIGNWGLWCKHVIDDLDSRETRFKWVAAPTADEILDLLPERITHRRCLYMTPTAEESLPDENNYYVFYEKASLLGEETGNPEFGGETLVEALAKMWIYLKENNFLESAE